MSSLLTLKLLQIPIFQIRIQALPFSNRQLGLIFVLQLRTKRKPWNVLLYHLRRPLLVSLNISLHLRLTLVCVDFRMKGVIQDAFPLTLV